MLNLWNILFIYLFGKNSFVAFQRQLQSFCRWYQHNTKRIFPLVFSSEDIKKEEFQLSLLGQTNFFSKPQSASKNPSQIQGISRSCQMHKLEFFSYFSFFRFFYVDVEFEEFFWFIFCFLVEWNLCEHFYLVLLKDINLINPS